MHTQATGPERLEKNLSAGSGAPVSFHARLRYAISDRGLTMESLEQLMGRSAGYVSRTLSESRDPRWPNAVEFARALKVNLEWLATGDGPMDQESAATGETFAMLEGWTAAAADAVQQPR